MRLSPILSGLLACTLIVAPCMTLKHSMAKSDNMSNMQHMKDSPDTAADTSCCASGMDTVLASIEQRKVLFVILSIAVIFTFVLSTITVTRFQPLLAREGPLYEQSLQHARTIVMRN